MSRQAETTSPAAAGGIFARLGGFIVRRPWVVIGIWAVVAGVLSLTVPSLEEISQKHQVAILPSNAPVLI